MSDGLKQRIVGALMLVIILVVLLPMLFDLDDKDTTDKTTQIPPAPQIEPVLIDDPVRPDAMEQAKSPDEMYQMNEQREQLNEGTPPPEDTNVEQPGLAEEGIPRAWVIQVGSFRGADHAEKLRDQLLRDGHKAYNRLGEKGGKKIYRVYVGPKIDKNEALAESRQIEQQYRIKTLLLGFEP